MKEKNFVGMSMCPICNECTGVLVHKYFQDIPKYSQGDYCDKCKKKIEDNVTLSCVSCKHSHTIKYEEIKKSLKKVKRGDRYNVYKCPKCPGESGFTLRPPEN